MTFLPCAGREQTDFFGKATAGPAGDGPHASGAAGELGGAGQTAHHIPDRQDRCFPSSTGSSGIAADLVLLSCEEESVHSPQSSGNTSCQSLQKSHFTHRVAAGFCGSLVPYGRF